MRALLILIILALQALFGWLLYKDNLSCCHPSETPLEIIKNSFPLSFLWSDPKPETTEGWSNIKDSLVASLGAHQQLEITAFYCNEEKTGSDSDTLAKQRAMLTRTLFPELKDEQVVFASRKVDCSTLNKTERFEAVSFAIRTENIVETADETLIYFPFNSTEKLNNTEVEEYLNKVIARVLKSKEIITLTGHTDNVGNEQSNLKLGQKRADIIKEYLLSGGVPPVTGYKQF
ncbi:MAG: OmpA family protein [Saprospiraceae bacterium]|nr:OmpA family protein [Saprospiraceae bacterium]